ncbi:MAG: SIS domain-containing protein [Candidatus Kariarchaeaceae archaeon]|jgi:fructoselysine 6-phosphate deglycase
MDSSSKNAVPDFEKPEFIAQLNNAKELMVKANTLAEELVNQGYNRLIFIGCGAPYRITNIIKSWIDLHTTNSRIRNYLPADFIDINPHFVDQKTIVMFGSYSGSTKETIDAAKFCSDKGCLRIGVTRLDDSPLSQNVDLNLNFGDTRLGDYSRFMISTAFVSTFLYHLDPTNWTYHEEIMHALHQLPSILGDVVEVTESRIRSVSETYFQTDSMFVVGHGPMYNTAYLLAFCSFMEMQWIHATPIIGAEFFHGPFELLDGSFPVIVLIGEDTTRPQGLRIKEFCENYLDSYVIFDSRDYKLKGIPEHMRGFFSPIVLDAATRRFMDYFAALRNHDKSKRRFMGVVNY